MGKYKINPLVLLGVPTLTDRPISWDWMDHYMNLGFPLGSSVARAHPRGLKIADARNSIVEQALSCGADYVFFLADDVLAPPRTFERLWAHKKDVVTGIYWTKSHPIQPYIWKGELMKGPYNDWKFGEFFEIDWAGCDCLLIHTDVFRQMEAPWFNTDWSWNEGEAPALIPTEDLYFYTKARKLGFKIWCDAGIQCDHQDRETGMRYCLTEQMPQYKDSKDWRHVDDKKLLIADVGCGYDTAYFGKHSTIHRIDKDPKVKPDILCDIRKIPQAKDVYDIVNVSHVLEHFPVQEAHGLVAEWTRILKIGGELIIVVPNLAFAAREILKAEENPAYNSTYAFWQLYGNHTTLADHEFHRCGYTIHGLRRVLKRVECLGEADVQIVDNDTNIAARVKKVKSSDPYPILPNYYGREATRTDAKQPAAEFELAPLEIKDNGWQPSRPAP